MMYKNKLAVALKSADGKVLREFGDQVYIPFGSEYSILLKNLNSRRALAEITIDGEDVGNGSKFVVDANSSFDIERFVKSHIEGNRFKFIERTSAVEKHKGIGVEDGLIRVEFRFETEASVNMYWNGVYRTLNNPDIYSSEMVQHKGMFDGPGDNSCFYSAQSELSRGIGCNTIPTSCATPANETGVTVAGSISDQRFQSVDNFATETTSHVIILKILGETEDNKAVREPVTVKAKPKCTSCGKKNKATAKFCSECGTSLQIIAAA